MHDGVTLALALLAAIAGMGWFALSMDPHWGQVRGEVPRPAALTKSLRVLGGLALAVALALCLVADSGSIAALVWVMALALAALTIAFTLTWSAAALRVLVFWSR